MASGCASEPSPFLQCSHQLSHGLAQVRGAPEGLEGPRQSCPPLTELGESRCTVPGSSLLQLPPQLQVLWGQRERIGFFFFKSGITQYIWELSDATS